MAQGQDQKSFVSAMPFMDQREILPELIDITNEEASLLDILELQGHSFPTKESQYHNIVNSELFQAGIVQSSSGAPGTTVTVVLTPATAQACISDSIVFLKSGARAFVQLNSNGTLTLLSIDGSAIALADVTAGVAMTFPSVAFGEGSLGASPERFTKTAQTNVVQIFKHKYQLTDIQLASFVEVNVAGEFSYQAIARIEAYLKFRKYVSLGLIVNTYSGDNFSASSSGLTDSAGNPVNVTRGLDQYVTSMGITYPAINANTIDLPDAQALDTTLNGIRAPKQYMLWNGTPMNQKWDIFLNAMNNSSMLSQSGRFLIEGDELRLGIKSFNLFGRDYHKMTLPAFDDPNTLAYAGVGNISQSGYLCPLGNVKTVGGGMRPYISTRYMSMINGKDLRYLEQHTGGLVDPITTDQAIDVVNFYSTQGLEVLAPNFFVKITP